MQFSLLTSKVTLEANQSCRTQMESTGGWRPRSQVTFQGHPPHTIHHQWHQGIKRALSLSSLSARNSLHPAVHLGRAAEGARLQREYLILRSRCKKGHTASFLTECSSALTALGWPHLPSHEAQAGWWPHSGVSRTSPQNGWSGAWVVLGEGEASRGWACG